MLLSEMLKDGGPLVSGSVLRFGMPAAAAGVPPENLFSET
jgi:hypothetical protein